MRRTGQRFAEVKATPRDRSTKRSRGDLQRHTLLGARSSFDALSRARGARAPGQTFFFGRWRTMQEAILRITRAPEMRGVTWVREGDQIVGRDGRGFEMRLNVELRKFVAPPPKIAYLHGREP